MSNHPLRASLLIALLAMFIATKATIAIPNDSIAEPSTHEQDAIEVARLVTAFVRGAANIRRITIEDVQVVSRGDSRNCLVRLSWRTKKKSVPITSVVSFTLIDSSQLHRIFRLHYQDTLGPVKHPESLLKLRSHLNEILEIEDRISPPIISGEGQPCWPGYGFVTDNQIVQPQ